MIWSVNSRLPNSTTCQSWVGMLLVTQTKDGWYLALINGFTERHVIVKFVGWRNIAVTRDSLKMEM